MPSCKPTGGQSRTTRDPHASGNSRFGIAILVKNPSSRKNGATWTTGAVSVLNTAAAFGSPDNTPALTSLKLPVSRMAAAWANSGCAASRTVDDPCPISNSASCVNTDAPLARSLWGKQIARATAEGYIASMSARHDGFAKFVAILGRGPGRSRALTRDEARDAFGMVLRGEADPRQVGAFLMLLRFRGEDAGEISGMVEAAREWFESPWPGP